MEHLVSEFQWPDATAAISTAVTVNHGDTVNVRIFHADCKETVGIKLHINIPHQDRRLLTVPEGVRTMVVVIPMAAIDGQYQTIIDRIQRDLAVMAEEILVQRSDGWYEVLKSPDSEAKAILSAEAARGHMAESIARLEDLRTAWPSL